MNLKLFQERALKEVKAYLEQLANWRKRAADNPDLEIDFPEKAWEKAGVGRIFIKKKDGCGRPLPVFCLKVPTGGGKTLLAVKTIDLVQSLYRQRQAGLVVWITPTLQIYRQTLTALKDRDHPYRQHLDMVSAGRTLIMEKADAFTPQDVDENLCVLMLMLPAAARKNKEALRMFRDAGAFQSFFPADEDIAGHAELRKRIPNLETFDQEDAVWGRQIKTSLGNTICLLEPLVILDEGQRAYSETAQKTLRDLNPNMIVELSATPPKTANVLVSIGGQALLEEEMIKLDLHIVNRTSVNWRDTMLASMQRRDELEAAARDYEANTNINIRPICLVQVERTGKEQRDGKLIHAEDVREYLLGQGVPKEQIAVKSAGTDELKDYDDIGGLLARDCPVRYIITKQALQEGWDCAFAYVLTVLTNPHSRTALTQLVGRILRQPNARKTHIAALDESYVYCFQRTRLLDEIRAGFQGEGLEEMQGRIVSDAENALMKIREIGPRSKFAKAAGNMVLPAFVIREGKDWRLVSYEEDILSRIRWEGVELAPLFDLDLSLEEKRDIAYRTRLYDDLEQASNQLAVDLGTGRPEFDLAHAAAHLLDVVPNPWLSYELLERVLDELLKRWRKREDGERIVANNWVFILEEMHKHLQKERDRLARDVFDSLLNNDEMRFIVVTRSLGFNRLPGKVEVPKGNFVRATRMDGSQFVLDLFDPIPADSINELEREVASFLDMQSQLYFWYRNPAHRGYCVQGWQRGRIFADFIFTTVGDKTSDYRKVFVLETKGRHLKNEDTEYKKSVFALCNKHAKKTTWNELVPAMKDKEIRYEVVFEDEWQQRLNALLS